MQYLDSFTLPSADAEDSYILNYPHTLEMQCYDHNNVYPFKIFPPKQLRQLDFTPITIFYGSNGSGKSTLLNIIAQKLKLKRSAPFNNTPFMTDYLKRCTPGFTFGRNAPEGSRIITSDDVFDFLLDIRSINEGVDRRREQLFEEYDSFNDPNAPHWQMRTLDDYEELKRRNEARGRTKSVYVSRRLPKELTSKSNGESAYVYFTQEIKENALYLLDEPENSLSAKLQNDLVQFIEDSVRFYRCQFILSTHSPFLLAMKGAKIYDLDSVPVVERDWTELGNVRVYYEFFRSHMAEFER
ncbi:MAG: AAA family ATPase [Clostridia bacterium]|nr:AAA family ATPase [Clostridia bacterium]